MEALCINSNLKTYSLSCDEPHMSFRRDEVEVNFRCGDQIIVNETNEPRPGLVLVSTPTEIRLCRFESNNGRESLFPPFDTNPMDTKKMILGQVVDHIRLSKWISLDSF